MSNYGLAVEYLTGGLKLSEQPNSSISGMIFDISTSNIPPLLGGGVVKPIFSLQDAENLGIKNDASDETKATGGAILIANVGTIGEKLSIKIQPDRHSEILLAEYIINDGDDVNTVAEKLNSDLALRFNNHKFTSTVSSATISLVAPDGFGMSLNGSRISFTSETIGGVAGTSTATLTQFSGGVGSELAVAHYHIERAYKINPSFKIYLMLHDFSTGDTDVYSQLIDGANGELRQMLVYRKDTFASSMVSSIQNQLAIKESEYRPCSCVLCADFSSFTEAQLINTRTIISKNEVARVSVDITQDGDARGNQLMGITGRSIGGGGALIGCLSKIDVASSVGTVDLNISDGIEFNVPALANGNTITNIIKVSGIGILKQLQNYGYCFAKSWDGYTGTYHWSCPNCTSIASDYGFIENVRTIDSVVLSQRLAYIPVVNSKLFVDATTGKLSKTTIEILKNIGLSELQKSGDREEISLDENGNIPTNSISIDNDRNVRENGLEIVIKCVPIPIGREILLKVGFTNKID